MLCFGPPPASLSRAFKLHKNWRSTYRHQRARAAPSWGHTTLRLNKPEDTNQPPVIAGGQVERTATRCLFSFLLR